MIGVRSELIVAAIVEPSVDQHMIARVPAEWQFQTDHELRRHIESGVVGASDYATEPFRIRFGRNEPARQFQEQARVHAAKSRVTLNRPRASEGISRTRLSINIW